MAKDLTSQMKAVLKEFSSEVVDAMDESVDKVAKEAVRKLKGGSPKDSGAYARSWSRRSEKPRIGSKAVTIYNKRYGWRTHLLENGHIARNKKGYQGRVPAEVHIAPVEEWAIEELPKEFEKELNK